jgi:2EXR family
MQFSKAGKRVDALGQPIPLTLGFSSITNGVCPFLELPPELRNKIYDLVFPECRILVVGNNPQKILAKSKKSKNPMTPKPRYRLSCHLLANRDLELTPVPLDILEVCRTINHEATAFLYGRTTFRFESIKTINKFLDLASRNGVANITSFEIVQNGYGEPYYTRDEYWKLVADRSWDRVCTRLATELTSLQNLTVDQRITTWPTQLKTTALWTRPLLTLGGGDDGLQRVRITLRHYMFNEKRLTMAARSLEDLMMNAKGREERDVEDALEAVREFEKAQEEAIANVQTDGVFIHDLIEFDDPVNASVDVPVGAKKKKKKMVLKITVPIAPENKAQGHSNPKVQSGENKAAAQGKGKVKGREYYQTKGLDKYCRVDLNTVGVVFW